MQNLGYQDYGNSQSESISNTKTTLQIASIFWGVVLLIVVIMSSSSGGVYSACIQDFKSNWELKPIVDIKTTPGEWPAGYESLIHAEWPGTETGCDWSFSFSYNGLDTGSCDTNRTQAGCTTVRSTDAMPLDKFYAYKICGKREGDPFYLMKFPTSSFGSEPRCPSYYKQWGKGTPDNLVWVKRDSPWPINDIIITQENDSKLSSGYSKAVLDNNLVVAFTNSSANRLPTVRLKLEQGEVCANPNEKQVPKGRYFYELLNSYSYGGCTSKVGGYYTDPRYREISTIKEDRLYKDNAVTYIIKNLPDYPIQDSSEYSWHLHTGDYFFWSQSCEQYGELTKDYMIEQINESVDVLAKQGYILITCILYFIICNVILECIAFQYNSENGDDSSKTTFCIINFCIKTALLIIMILLFFGAINVTNQYNNSITLLNKYKCTDAFGNTLFQEFSKSLSSTASYNYFGVILCFISLGLMLVYMMFDMCMGSSKRSPPAPVPFQYPQAYSNDPSMRYVQLDNN